MTNILAQICSRPVLKRSQFPVTLVMKGGVVMIPILSLWIATTYIFIERYLYLRQKTKRTGISRQHHPDDGRMDVMAATIYADKRDISNRKSHYYRTFNTLESPSRRLKP